jgi:hypothetical protein
VDCGASLERNFTGTAGKVDASGNLIGIRVHHTLDNAGNRMGEDIKDASNSLKQHRRTYDALNRL